MKHLCLVLLMLFVVGCAKSMPVPSTATPTDTAIPTETPIPTTTPSPSPTATPTPAPCSVQSLEYFEELDALLQEWEMSQEIAFNTPRVALTQPLSELHELRKLTAKLMPPPCAAEAQELILAKMDGTIHFLAAYMGDSEMSKIRQECGVVEIAKMGTLFWNERRRIETDGAFVPTPTPTRLGMDISREQVLQALDYEIAYTEEGLFAGCDPQVQGHSKDFVFEMQLIGPVDNMVKAYISYHRCQAPGAEASEKERIWRGFSALLGLVPDLPETVVAEVEQYVRAYDVCGRDYQEVRDECPEDLKIEHGVLEITCYQFSCLDLIGLVVELPEQLR